MASYKELLAQRAMLEQQIEEARQARLLLHVVDAGHKERYTRRVRECRATTPGVIEAQLDAVLGGCLAGDEHVNRLGALEDVAPEAPRLLRRAVRV